MLRIIIWAGLIWVALKARLTVTVWEEDSEMKKEIRLALGDGCCGEGSCACETGVQ